MAGGGMGGGGNSAVAGGMNLSTPTLSNGTLGLPQTSQLSGMQNLYGGLTGNQNYQMFPSQWQQILQHLQQSQPPMQQPMQQTQQNHGGSLGSAAHGIGSVIGLLGLL
jgi:hypothetical protein